MNLWIIDPKTKERSVSLTILIVSVAGTVTAIVLQALGKADASGAAENFFMASAALYAGRKYTSSKGSSIEEQPKE